MKTMVRMIMAMAVGLLLMMLAGTAVAQTASPESDFAVNAANGAITGYLGPGGDVVIPDSVFGYKVRSIGNAAFRYDTTITSITIPAGVTSIGQWAFMSCSALTNVTLTKGLTTIQSAAFIDCYALRSINFPDGLTSIGDQAFYECYALASVNFPSSLTYLGSAAFYECTALTSVAIPEGITCIGYSTFYDCPLTRITIPASVDSIGYEAFGIAFSTLINNGSSMLREVHILNPVPPKMGEYVVFDNVDLANCALFVPDGSVAAYQAAAQWGEFATIATYAEYWADAANWRTATAADFTIQNGVIMRYKGAGGNVWIPDSINGQPITGIDNRAFQGNNRSSLTAIRLPNGLKTLDTTRVIHRNDSSYTVDTLIDTVYIAEQTFQSCENLSAVIMGDSLRSIGNDAFALCPNLRYVSFPRNLQTIGEYAFADCSALTRITLPDNIDSIANYAFYNCTALSTVTLGVGLRKLEEHAFYNCLAITTLNSRSLVPSALGMNVFGGYGFVGGGVPIANCVLYVPETSGTDYRAADVWRDFTTISATIPVGHDTIWTYVHDTATVHDTTRVHDTIHLDTARLHDTIYLDTALLHDTIYLDTTELHDTLYDTITRTFHRDTIIYKYDTSIVKVTVERDTIVYDTTEVDTTIYKYDTTEVDTTIYKYDTTEVIIHDTTHDTTEVEVTVHDTTTLYDTVTRIVHRDSIVYINEYRDTLYVTDTLRRDTTITDTTLVNVYDTTRRDTLIVDTTLVELVDTTWQTVDIIDTLLTIVEIVDTTLVPETLIVRDTIIEEREVQVPVYIVIDPIAATKTVVSEDARAVDVVGMNGVLLEGLTPDAPYAVYSTDGTLAIRGTATASGGAVLRDLSPGTYLLWHMSRWSKFTHK